MNTYCPGFVQVNSKIPLSINFDQVSTVNGTQYDYPITIFQDQSTLDWWLIAGPNITAIGYWPKELFPFLKMVAIHVEWGGYLYKDDATSTTAPQMGSGLFPEQGYGKAAYFKQIQIVQGEGGFVDPPADSVNLFSDRPQCYKVGPSAELLFYTGYHFYYGGPGGDNNSRFVDFFFLLVQTEYGDIFDCVDINKQPALDHPLLKNHRVQKKPSVFPKGLGPKTSAKTQSSKIGLPDGGCPEGTVPIKRITKRDLLWMKSLKRNTTKFHPMDANTPGYHQVFTRQYPSKYYGAQGGLSLHSEPAANHQSHRAMITVSGGSPDKLNAIQVGWMVDNFVNTGCRDLFCPGYVQVDSSVAPGMTFYNLSTVDGPQFDYYFVILQMNATDENWWLMSLGDETRTIGYWPQALFPDMKESFTNLEWGGYVFNDDPKTTTSPQMGSGHFPEEGYGKAAYFRDIKLMRDPQEGFAIVSTEEQNVKAMWESMLKSGINSKCKQMIFLLTMLIGFTQFLP
uniref:Neprosin PEP catalytic domain-containing protein n=1 Tax=Vitis vinifera TaxID=29760 RepID=F6H6M9_VITVI